MTISNNTANRRRWVGAFAAVVACLTMADRHGRSDDAKGGPKPGAVITNSIGMKLALIPAGDFLMGSPADEADRDVDERQHRVRITRSFHLGVHEVTQKEWSTVMLTTPWKGEEYVKEGDRYPATQVSWEDATEFCRKLTMQEQAAGRLESAESYRLPTEAEWEYACRAGTTTRFHFGNKEGALGDYAWCRANTINADESYSHEVGRKRANAWGLFDMHGNVPEWCSDRFDRDYYRVSPMDDPRGPSTSSIRVVRGGGWSYPASFCRSAYRSGGVPSVRSFNLGFRLARSSGTSK